MRYQDIEVNNIAELLNAFSQQIQPGELIWYRGQSVSTRPLIPSLARQARGIEAEFTLCKRFMQNAVPFRTLRPKDEWEWLFLMQHHGVPTRLLDWTESPLVGLYFAVDSNLDQDGALWCLLPTRLNEQANITYDFSAEIPCFGYDSILDNYLPTRIAGERGTRLSPVAALALRENPRMYAQLGTFTITHREQTALEAVGATDHVWKIVIPSASKQSIKQQLSYLRITKLTLFPELDNVALIAKEVLA
jgi:FRG domain